MDGDTGWGWSSSDADRKKNGVKNCSKYLPGKNDPPLKVHLSIKGGEMYSRPRAESRSDDDDSRVRVRPGRTHWVKEGRRGSWRRQKPRQVAATLRWLRRVGEPTKGGDVGQEVYHRHRVSGRYRSGTRQLGQRYDHTSYD